MKRWIMILCMTLSLLLIPRQISPNSSAIAAPVIRYRIFPSRSISIQTAFNAHSPSALL